MSKTSHEDQGSLVSFLLQEVLEEQAGGGEDKAMSFNALAILTHQGHIGEVGSLAQVSVRGHLVGLELVPLEAKKISRHLECGLH